MASGLFNHRVPVDVGEEAQTKPEIVDKSFDNRIFNFFPYSNAEVFLLR